MPGERSSGPDQVEESGESKTASTGAREFLKIEGWGGGSSIVAFMHAQWHNRMRQPKRVFLAQSAAHVIYAHPIVGGHHRNLSIAEHLLTLTWYRDDPTKGDRIIVVVQKQRSFGPESGGGSVSTSAANKVRRGDIRHAVVVRTVKKLQRPDGSVVKFDDNACVLINKSGDPIGTRLNGESEIFHFLVELDRRKDYRRDSTRVVRVADAFGTSLGIVGSELRDKKWSKILSLAPMHL
ncbi:hypothetical protein FGG08_005249 [Glutinoglossum americanum]|uniref:50S ribosomal protein L14 n=1 Tax=Glutinoglossum americanum TaxID=1670608 RepID=A0A9P8L1L8_9PEZI|nr:hypothetical protein FGG08_005249 [Glutinoglossum americanum]